MISQYKYILSEPLYMFWIIRAIIRCTKDLQFIGKCNRFHFTLSTWEILHVLRCQKLEANYTNRQILCMELYVHTALIILLGSYQTAQQTWSFWGTLSWKTLQTGIVSH